MIVAMEFEELYRKDGSHIDQGIVELRARNFPPESVCNKKIKNKSNLILAYLTKSVK